MNASTKQKTVKVINAVSHCSIVPIAMAVLYFAFDFTTGFFVGTAGLMAFYVVLAVAGGPVVASVAGNKDG